jgi:hypothetical protein
VRHRGAPLRLFASVALALAGLVVLGAPLGAQEADDPPTTVVVPDQQIVPSPNSGSEPTEAGDRGGVLQLGLLVLVVVVIGVAVSHLVRQSRRARADRTGQP